MKRTITTAVLALLCVAGLVAVGGADPTPAAAPESRPARVATGTVADGAASRAYVFHSVSRAGDRALVAFPVGGRLVARSAEVGSQVERGQAIAELDQAPYRNQLQAAQAAIDEIDTRLAQLEREEARAERLIAASIGNEQAQEQIATERDALTAARRAAEAQLAEARRQRDEATLRAPISGTVAEVFANPGEVVGPGTPVAAIVGEGVVEVEFDVPETVFSRIGEGQEVTIALPLSGGREVAAIVTGVSRSAAGRGRLFPVVARLADGTDVVPGMAAEVRVEVAETAGLTVPVAAVIDPTGADPTVIAVREGVADFVSVRPLGMHGERVRVAGDLRGGETVVTSGHAQLQAGDVVEAAP